MSDHGTNNAPATFGVIAEFENPEDLLDATKKAYGEGYRKMDAYSPFPIHGLGHALGMKKTGVAPIVLAAGLSGATGGFLMQTIATTWHYPYSIGGRPNFSWPAFIPITFECGILCAAFGALLGMLLLNGLPQPYHPIFNAKNFKKASSSGFFLCIEADDEKFDEAGTAGFLETLAPGTVSVVEA
jgi:hypothetical protein